MTDQSSSQETQGRIDDLKQTVSDTTNKVAHNVSQRADELRQTISEVPGKVDEVRQQVETAFQHEPLATVQREATAAGTQLLAQAQALVAEGNTRRLMVKNQQGQTLLEVPLTLGVAAGAGALLAAPFWATIGTIAALVAQVYIVIERYDNTQVEIGDDKPEASRSRGRKNASGSRSGRSTTE